jgi:hypothetical protein
MAALTNLLLGLTAVLSAGLIALAAGTRAARGLERRRRR